MSTASTRLPEGRYGRSAGERSDRTLKIVGAVLSAGLLVLVAWLGIHHVGGSRISAEVITFDIGDTAIEARLEVHKDAGVSGYCTLRSQGADGGEVGRADFRFEGDATRFDRTVTLRTTAPGTTAELMGCHAD
ncbi:DUF4307 domain-containing protein [Streptomyces sp. CRN 30]|uniref:DUF4307 domain-containing protein n=1 Tax=Streptomyces sp. CRN 30 TaxID=3075613 RepID=UPI002A80616C|nr:DUF4307 domain-containing protein [Streptomyces sp. CRN 30]